MTTETDTLKQSDELLCSPAFRCKYDTDGDGDCHRCKHRGTCGLLPITLTLSNWQIWRLMDLANARVLDLMNDREPDHQSIDDDSMRAAHPRMMELMKLLSCSLPAFRDG